MMLATTLAAGFALTWYPGSGTTDARPANAARVVHGSAQWAVYGTARTDGFYLGIAAGPDGAMWLSDFWHGLVRIDTTGHRQVIPLVYTAGGRKHVFLPAAIALGADGRFYLTGCVDNPTRCSVVAVAGLDGSVHVLSTPSGDSPRYNGIGEGPDGNVWFAERGHVARITPTGAITEYAYASGEATNQLSGIAAGTDGNVWFTEVDQISAGKIDPATGLMTEYALKPQAIDCGVSGMAAAADGDLYFGCGTGIVQMTTGGVGRYFATGYQLSDSPLELTRGPDGYAWASALTALQQVVGGQSTIVTFVPPNSGLTLYACAAGPDGRLWVIAEDGTVYALPPPTPPVRERR